MPARPTSVRCQTGLRVVALLLCGLAGATVQAAPEAADPVARFLGERGLVETAPAAPAPAPTEPSLAHQVRDRASLWASELVISAMNFLDVRYRRGGNSAEQGFDCSGFTRHVFESSLGLVLPRRSQEQARTDVLLAVGRHELQPGDLVFFNTLRAAFSHVGIYIGDGKFIHSPRTGAAVRVEDMRLAYWTRRYDGARRAPQPAASAAVPAGAAPGATPPPPF